MKKKILLIAPSLTIGGAERSLLGLLEAIDYSKVEVSLMLYRHEGELLKDIPKGPVLLPELSQYRTFDVPIFKLIQEKKFLFAAARIASIFAVKIHTILTGQQPDVWIAVQYITRFLQPLLPQIVGKYDLGIMFLGVGDTLLNKVDASKKIVWCHTDYNILHPNKKIDANVYEKTDNIVTVSAACKKAFDAFYPEYANKTIVIENILSKSYVSKMSEEKITFNIKKNALFLLSIGRFCEAKNFDNIPSICKLIRQQGLDVKWYLIGYGGDEALIRKNIREQGMEDHVIILGKKENPYPYIKACDVYVQPSRYEGKCVAVREAQMLGKPVIITNYATSASQLEDGVDGVIVPMDNEGCARGITAVLQDPQLMAQLAENCRQKDYSNSQEVEKIYQLLEHQND